MLLINKWLGDYGTEPQVTNEGVVIFKQKTSDRVEYA